MAGECAQSCLIHAFTFFHYFHNNHKIMPSKCCFIKPFLLLFYMNMWMTRMLLRNCVFAVLYCNIDTVHGSYVYTHKRKPAHYNTPTEVFPTHIFIKQINDEKDFCRRALLRNCWNSTQFFYLFYSSTIDCCNIDELNRGGTICKK